MSVTFTWPGKEEASQLAIDALPIPNSQIPIPNSGSYLIEADNLTALKALQKEFAGVVKCIYTDPPYNTGNTSFMYADTFRTKGRDAHTDWLSMMYPRLLLARPLLREDGVIFISIDDSEQAHLRLLMNEVFGEDNFVGQAIWHNRTTPNDAGANFAADHEYILIYAKDKRKVRFAGIAKDLSKYANRDGDPAGAWIPDNPSAASGTDSYRYPIINPHTGQEYRPPKGRYWAFAPARVAEWADSGKLVFPKEAGRNFLLKKYQHELRSELKPMSSVISGILTAQGTKELKALFGGASPFRFPKPVALIKHLVAQATGEEDVVLDFFAGSGTTAQAVLELNAESGSRRRFICIQRREANSSKDAELRGQYPFVSDVTRARIGRVMAKCGGGESYDVVRLD